MRDDFSQRRYDISTILKWIFFKFVYNSGAIYESSDENFQRISKCFQYFSIISLSTAV